jgi:parvulin-like peptidyl-prolyl isomerase
MHPLVPLALLAAVLLPLPSARAADAPNASLFNDVVVAKGQGIEVRRGQLDDAFVSFKANLAARGQAIREEQRLGAEAQLLDRLIVSQLLVKKATPADKAKASQKADHFLEEARKSAGSEEAYTRQLRVLGITPLQFTNRVVEQAIAEELLGREIKSKIIITPEEVQKFYATNDAAFQQPEMARASHILIYTRDLKTRLDLPEDQKKAKLDKAERALARARKGEDFTKLVEEFSEDAMVKENKGEYKFTRAKDDPRRAMVPEFEVAAFGLKPGEISRIVKTEYGYHIIKLYEITPPRKTPFTEVSDRVRDLLLGREMEARLPDYFAKLKSDAQVEILDERLKEALAQEQKAQSAAKK